MPVNRHRQAGQGRGTRREYQVRDLLRDKGWIAFRAPASLGVADIVALRAAPFNSEVMLIEVKATTRRPYEAGFGPIKRRALSAAAEKAGAVAVLAWWPPRGKLQWFYEYEWPNHPQAAVITVNK